MHAIRVIADDLTGACDVGAELLPWPGGVGVLPGPDGARGAQNVLWVRNTQSRTVAAADAVRRVSGALGDLGPGWAGVVLKKIDTGLRGHLGAEIDGAMAALGIEEAFVLPAIPEIGRTTQGGVQMIGGVPVHLTPFARDPRNPIRDASVPATINATSARRVDVVDLASVRNGIASAVERARAAGAAILVCDAETDADLERAVRGLLGRPRPLLLVGSAGLARALRSILAAEPGGRFRPVPPAPGSGILVVAGSAHPATRAQVARASGRGLLTPFVIDDPAAADGAGLAAAQLLRAGRTAALIAPEAPIA